MLQTNKIFYKIFKVFGWILLVLLFLLIGLVLFIRSPWGQGIIVDKAVSYVTSKTHSKIELDRLFVTFSGNLYLEGLYMEDQKGDTLLYSQSLETGVKVMPLIQSGSIHLTKLDWEGLKARVKRNESDEQFNFDFILSAFSSPSESTGVEEQETQKDSTASSPEIRLGPIHFSNLDIRYEDEVMGIDSHLKLGVLSVETETIDLNKMDFYVRNLDFENTELYYRQTKPFVPSEEDPESATPMPVLIVDQLSWKNITAFYESVPDGMKAEVKLGEFFLVLPEADLESQKIRINDLRLLDSDIQWTMREQTQATQEEVETAAANEAFEWPDWLVEVNALALERNRIRVQIGDIRPQKGYFNPSAFDFTDFNLLASQIYFGEKEAGLSLDQFDWKEYSGFELQSLTFDFGMDDRSAKLLDLDLRTGSSRLGGNVQLDYPSLEAWLQDPTQAGFELDIPELTAHIEEFLVFAPELAQEEYFRPVSQKEFKGELKARGDFSRVLVDRGFFSWGENTDLDVKGTVQNPMDIEQLGFDMESVVFNTLREDVLLFVKEEELGIQFPDAIHLESSAKGSLEDMELQAVLNSPQGKLNVDGHFAQREQLVFRGKLAADGLDFGHILPGQGVGMVSFELEGAGSGEDLESLDATLASRFEQLEYNQYDFAGLTLEGEIRQGEGHAQLLYEDENLDLDLEALVKLDSVKPRYEVLLDLKGADLMALGITEKAIATKLKLRAEFEGTPEAFDTQLNMSDGIVSYDQRSYPLGALDLTARVREDSTSFDLNSMMVNSRLRSNASPQQLLTGLERHFKYYFADSAKWDTVPHPVHMSFDLSFKRAPVLDQVFLQGLEQLDSVIMALDFDEAAHELTASLDLPFIRYNDIEVDSLGLRVNADQEDLRFGFGLISLTSDPLLMGKTYFSGELEHRKLLLDFLSFEEEDSLYHIGSSISFNTDTLDFQLSPDDLVLYKRRWTVPESNHIRIAKNYVEFTDFSLSRNGQKINFSNAMEGVEEEHLGIAFENFQLATLLGLLNPEELIAEGKVQGQLVVENPFSTPGIVANLGVDDLKALGVELGNMSLKAQSMNTRSYDFNLALKGGDLNLDLVGDYQTNEEGADLNLDLSLAELKLAALEQWSSGQLSEGEGSLTGKLKVTGNPAAPEYQGEFFFQQAALKVNALNSKFKFPEEPLRIDEDGIYLKQFTFRDNEDNTFTLDGDILTESFANPSFDLQLRARQFRLLDSKRSDNELFFGKANINLDMEIGGHLNLPRIKADLKVNKGTDLTFVVPESELEVVEREGVVLYINRDDPNDILTKRNLEREDVGFKGMQVNALIRVDPEAALRIVVDERSGDNLMIAGEADLNFNMEPNGRMNLTGIYEVNKGHYEMSLYNLVSRKFNIEEGSTITWKGAPTDADLNISASYAVKTSSMGLMDSQLSGVDAEVAGRYRQELPFLVYLNINGELLRPQIFFRLDMPEDDRGALGGNVFSRVQQINEEEGELNRQVFSLLVLNRFFPTSGSDGSRGGASGLARSSVSQMLSGQLNALSSNILGKSGFELDFDLDSFTDYQSGSPQERTQVNVSARKRLFSDRLIVQVGSQMDLEGTSQNTERNGSVFGNVSIEYLLTENGRYRLRGFRKNQFESIIDGQLIVTGLALIFNREFNRFYELWKGVESGSPVMKTPDETEEEAEEAGSETAKEEDKQE